MHSYQSEEREYTTRSSWARLAQISPDEGANRVWCKVQCGMWSIPEFKLYQQGIFRDTVILATGWADRDTRIWEVTADIGFPQIIDLMWRVKSGDGEATAKTIEMSWSQQRTAWDHINDTP